MSVVSLGYVRGRGLAGPWRTPVYMDRWQGIPRAGLAGVLPLPSDYAGHGHSRGPTRAPDAYFVQQAESLAVTPKAIDAISTVDEAEDHAFVGFGKTKAQAEHDPNTAARQVWLSASYKYRWVADLADWFRLVGGVQASERAEAVAGLKSALRAAQNKAREANPGFTVAAAAGNGIVQPAGPSAPTVAAIRLLQTSLNSAGYRDARGQSLAVDGDLGRRALEALATARAAVPNLPAGSDDASLRAIAVALAALPPRPSPSPTTPPPPAPTPAPTPTPVPPAPANGSVAAGIGVVGPILIAFGAWFLFARTERS